jgi:2-oxoglutarate ferredoxin oxidoreductase subunit beta
VTFNDHEGSTKSYAHTRQFYHHVIDADFVPPAEEITAAYDEGDTMPIELHDGSKIVFRKVDKDYDPTSRAAAFSFLRNSVNAGEIITGLLYIDEESGDMHNLSGTVERPLSKIPYEELNPGAESLNKLMSRYR